LFNWHKKISVFKKTFNYVGFILGLLLHSYAQAYTGVTIVMGAATPTNLEFIDNFRQELINEKQLNLKVKVINLEEVEKLVVAENSELVIALGVKALGMSSKLSFTTPVLGVFTPLPAYNNLLASSKRTLGSFSAIVLDQPNSRRLLLIKTILPEAKSVGVLMGSTSMQDADNLKEVAEKLEVVINQENVYQDSELITKLSAVLESSDALLALPDPFVYSRETAQSILLTSYRYQKPVFGYSQSYVQAGALAGVYTNTKQLAKQAAEIAMQSQQAIGGLPPPQAPKYFSVMINRQVGRSLKIQLLDEETIHKKIVEIEAMR
jgi:putative tryptophan/tyrosine transport system substrate-binding protein